ncbi:SDR family NAD(P)-dependent oxidoreductase [Echinicola rosea]|uniref:3-oxoacyl-ACP reductase n=1 Tax=Echinicola rosea TaxID=1807691 RepID=A0ABQ1VC10_9BACT|nr:SDR family oxidoreductase [Echinicola rosea]GGF50123.1 3-oxoacyl-ACP reductase [Echinicola rosea]
MNITKTNRPIAIVTGGASGLGLATAKKFCNNNIKTIIIGRNETKLAEAQKVLGANCHYYPFDLNDLNNIPELINSIIAEHGKIDILINNAGINMKKPFMAVTDEEFQQIITTNVSAVFSLSREVAKVMTDQKSGAIVNISSMASQYGIPKVIAYTASKSAIEGMTKAMAVELSPLGIRVNCVAPGFIATDMSAKALNNDPERKQKVLSRTPMGTLGTPEHIADAVYYLASENASYITGTILPVDGGNAIGF